MDVQPVRPTLLIYAPVPLFRQNGHLYLEIQACNGLRLWAENFQHVNVMMPIENGPAPADWVPIDRVGPSLDRIEIHPLPTAYRPDRFLREYRSVRKTITNLIDRSDYLSFAIGGLFGDWGSVACLQAHRMGRRFAVWTDRVESEVLRSEAKSGPMKQQLKARLYHRPMAALERHVIRRAEMGLFHGRDTFDFYAPYCRNSELVHDIHISKSDHIAPSDLVAKIARVVQGPLRLVYVGRMDAMKGPSDWVEVLERLDNAGVDFEATWLGAGDEFGAVSSQVNSAGLNQMVKLPGFNNDRRAVLQAMRDAHIFLFCHKTPELPRCLIEALISGCPIVGYGSAYPADLISGHAGGRLVPMNDTPALANAVAN